MSRISLKPWVENRSSICWTARLRFPRLRSGQARLRGVPGSIGFGDDDALRRGFARDDALARPVVAIHQRNAPDAGLDFLEFGVAAGIVFHVGRDKFSAAFFRRDSRENMLDPLEAVRQHRVVLHPPARRFEQFGLHRVERLPNGLAQPRRGPGLLALDIAPPEDDAVAFHFAGTDLDHHGDAALLPMEELVSGRVAFAVVHLYKNPGLFQLLGQEARALDDEGALRVLPVDRNKHDLDGRELRRQDQAAIVGMAHHQRADQAGADPPTGLPDMLETPPLVLY